MFAQTFAMDGGEANLAKLVLALLAKQGRDGVLAFHACTLVHGSRCAHYWSANV